MINAQTELYGVFGHPVAHSLSPVMHSAAFRELGINAVYLAFDVVDLKGAVDGVRALNLNGLSVTIPHKISIMVLLDEIDPLAEKIGAVNTIVVREGRLIGCNTDGEGAITALREKTELGDKRIAVIGAGGAARAVGFTARRNGGNVTIVNRSVEKGEQLADDLDADFVPLAEFNGECDILVNTTPLGMAPETDRAPVPEALLQPGMVVMDIVYNPLTTRLLRDAAARGCTTVDGVAMFVHQGAMQFERWTGRPAPVDLMRRTVLSELEGKGRAYD